MSWINAIVNDYSCSICGGRRFRPGPNSRLNNGLAPCCLNCFSLERHRIIFNCYQKIPRALLADAACLHLAPDQGIRADWFRTYEPSTYGGQNSVDIQQIDREDGTYDWVICNHVLEHVQDDAKAIGELLRILKPNGILQFAIPNPLYREKSSDWGFPDWKIHGHWRIYGKDFLDRFEGVLDSNGLLPVASIDPVTGFRDVLFFASKSKQALNDLKVVFDPSAET